MIASPFLNFNIVRAILVALILSYTPSAIAGVPTEANSAESAEVPSDRSSSLISPIPNQTSITQFNNAGLSALTYPNCGGTCIFAIGRMVPTMNGTSAEMVAGVVWQLRSPENTQAEAQQKLLKAQTEKLSQESTLILTEKLADALEQKKSDRVTLLAMMLAQRLGYADYHQFLKQLDRKN